MAPSDPRNRRPGTRPPARRPADEVMELNTADVMPVLDDDAEYRREEARAKPPPPVAVMPSVEITATRSRKSPAPKARRPNVEVTAPVEMMETEVLPSLPARQHQVSDAGYSEAFLYVEKGPGAGQLVPILQGDLVIGRSSDSSLQINHPSVSRRHAILARRGEQYFLEDAGSQNGTYVNWARIRGEVEIFPGDQIGVGSAALVLRGGLYVTGMRRSGGTSATTLPSKANRWLIGAGVFGAAMGIGLAAVWILAGSASRHVAPPAHVAAVSQVEAPSAAPVANDEPVRAAPAPAPIQVAAAHPRPATLEIVDDPQPARPVERTPVRHAAPPPAPARHEKAERAEKPEKKERVEKATKVASVQPEADVDAPEAVLKVYETGNVAGALAAAQSAGASGLAAKLRQFQTAYDAARTALANKDGPGAVSNFNKALKLDESIDSGWGKLNGEIRGQLASLYVLSGNQALGRNERDTAAKAFKAALNFQPANGEARARLKELETAHAERAANPRSAADAAFESSAPAKPKAVANPRSAADAAFDN